MKHKTLLCSLALVGALFLQGCDMMTSSSSSSHSSSHHTSTSMMPSTSSMTSSNNTSTNNVYYGEYKETSYGQEYTTKVKVMVENGKIQKVEIIEGSNPYTDGTSWPGNTAWTSKEQEVLKSYEGKSVDEIKNSNNIVVDNVAGATLTSNRVYQAIKDALK